MSEEQTVERLKKFNEPAFVCKHLLINEYLHLNFPVDIDDDEAWCDECEKILQEEKGWTDRALKFADIKPCCRCCFAELKERYPRR